MPDAGAHSIRTPRDRSDRVARGSGIDGKTVIDNNSELEKLESLAGWMDSAFRIPGTGIRFGLDSLTGLVPGVGDTAARVPSGYIVMAAWRLGVSNVTTGKMLMNIGIDWLIGLVPLVGDIFDVGFKANRKNVDLVRRELEKKSMAAQTV